MMNSVTSIDFNPYVNANFEVKLKNNLTMLSKLHINPMMKLYVEGEYLNEAKNSLNPEDFEEIESKIEFKEL